MRLFFLFVSLLVFRPAFAQENETIKQFAIQLSLNDRYRDTLNWDERIQQAVISYEQLLKKLETEGKIILAGSVDLPPRAPERYDIIILQPMTMAEARGILQQLPVVTSGMMRARLYPFELKTKLPATVAPSD